MGLEPASALFIKLGSVLGGVPIVF